MLFELFLVAGITILPISVAALLISALLYDEIKNSCIVGIVVGLVCILMAVTLPPIPIIPQ